MVGDGEDYIAALLVLDPEVAPGWAASHGASGTTLAELAHDPVVLEEIAREVATANERFSHAEAGAPVTRCCPTSGCPTARSSRRR